MANLKELTDKYYDVAEAYFKVGFDAKELLEEVRSNLNLVKEEINSKLPLDTGDDTYVDALLEYEDTPEGEQKVTEKRALEDLERDIIDIIHKIEDE